VLFQKVEAGYEYNFLTLDVADVNRNGYAEIIVTSVINDNLRSFIIEMEEGKFRKIVEDASWYYRVLEHPKDGIMLMGQAMDRMDFIRVPFIGWTGRKTVMRRGRRCPFRAAPGSSVWLWPTSGIQKTWIFSRSTS